jgi:hypothetical protein
MLIMNVSLVMVSKKSKNGIYLLLPGERESILSDSFKGGGAAMVRPCRAQDANEISVGDE